MVSAPVIGNKLIKEFLIMRKYKTISALIAAAFILSPVLFLSAQVQPAATGSPAVQEDTVSAEKTAAPAPEADQTAEAPDTGAGLFGTIKQGGTLMIFIIIAGLISLTIIIERVIYFTRNKVWFGETLPELINHEAEKSNAKYREELEDDLRSSFREYADGLERGLTLLAGIGNLAPIIGFLGTVIGMISAFAAIAAATTVNAKVVAVGIQVALVTTAGGLVVAAPTLVGYYIFMHIIQNRYASSEIIINSIVESMPRLSDKAE